jgi:hypothetical protein
MWLIFKTSYESRHALQVLRRIDPKRFILGFHHADAMTVLDGPQLFQPFHPLEGTHRKTGIGEQKITPVNIKTQVLIMNSAAFTRKRNGAAGKIDRIAREIGDHFDDVGVADLTRVFNDLHQRGHRNVFIVQQRQRRGINGRWIDQRFVALDVHDDRGVV